MMRDEHILQLMSLVKGMMWGEALEFCNGDEAGRTHMAAWGFDINV